MAGEELVDEGADDLPRAPRSAVRPVLREVSGRRTKRAIFWGTRTSAFQEAPIAWRTAARERRRRDWG